MFVVVLAVVLSVLSGTSWYLARRLHQGLSAVLTGLRFWPVLTVICAIVLLLVLGFSRSMLPLSGAVKHILGVVSSGCMGFFLYLLLFTVAADLLLLIPRLLKLPFTLHRVFKAGVAAGVLMAALGTCVYGFFNARQIDHVSYDIPLQEGRKDISSMNVVLISDLHLGAVGSEGRLESIVAEINALKPDLICIAGDFFDTDFSAIQDPDAALQTLRKLHATYGAYACLGNHDAGATHEKMTAFLQQADIHLLNDAYTVIGQQLVLVGRLDGTPIGGFGGEKRKPLADFFTREDPALPVIVLDHNPANIHEYADEADLILCGHTHKGQVFPGSLITDRMYTVDYGHYQKDAHSPHVVVTSGVGAWGMPIRVGTDSEIVTLRFVSAGGQ